MIAFEKPTLDDLNYISMKLRERDFIELADLFRSARDDFEGAKRGRL